LTRAAGHTYYTYASEAGPFTLASDGAVLVRFAFGRVAFDGACAPCALTNRAATEVQQYLSGRRQVFDVPLRLEGTPFQKDVWAAIANIPYGQTRTYADVAASAGHPGASRAVGQACNANPLAVFVPCHRVVGAHGRLGGYAFGPARKEFLLELEGARR
jgi:methylated-DNA-[protein]-cysteine S-methyltransferase